MRKEIDALLKNGTWDLVPRHLTTNMSHVNSSLFIKNNLGAHIVILLYIDDIIVIGSDEEQIAQLRRELVIHFEMKNLGEAKYFLGLEIEKLMDGYYISQSRNEELKLIGLPDADWVGDANDRKSTLGNWN
ncbi:Copia protein, partial [Mucuna pruriens]